MAGDSRPDRAFYEALVDSSPLVVFRLSGDGLTVTYVSSNSEQLFGWDAETVTNPGWSWLDLIHPDDVDGTAELFAGFVSDPAEPMLSIFRLLQEDRDARWVAARFRSDPTAPGQLFGFVLDIHDRVTANAEAQERRDIAEGELRRSQVFLDSIIENIPDMVFVKDARDLSFVRFNRAGEELIGRSRDELLGKNDYDLFPKEQADAFTTADREVLEQQVLHDIAEEEIDTVHGGRRLLHTKKIPLLGDDGEPTYLLGISEDITERRITEMALRSAKEEAERANRAKSEFLSRMSHELRTPLNSILGFGQLLELDDLTESQVQAVNQILRGGRHLLDLINEILDISRIEAGSITLSLEPVALDTMIQECLDLVRPQAQARSIELVNDDGGQRHVQADRQRLRQVLLNLLSNAVKFNRDAGRITISCDHEDHQVRVNVTDTGPGIRPELQDRLFTPFDRLEAELGGVEGTGLGLALSLRLVEAMHGTIGVDSIPGEGSTFWFVLPVGPEEAAADVQRANGVEAAPKGPATATVLYIEDNLANLRLVEQLLVRRPGTGLVSAMQGSLGVELAAQHQPDLILLDVHLPDMPGDVVLQRLKAEPSTAGIPVVVVSADATEQQIRRFRQLGADDYLTKPFDIAALLAAMDPHIAP
jgi:PAS domain S-box-containing protein